MSVGFAVLAVMAGIAGAACVDRLRGSATVRHTVEVDGSLARILSTIQDAETGQRGYLLTGDETFLAPYARSAPVIAGRITALRMLMQGNAAQLERLEALVREKIAELQATIDRQRRGDTPARAFSVIVGSQKMLYLLVWSLFFAPNRRPLRRKML